MIQDAKGQERAPAIHFRAKDPSPKRSTFGQPDGAAKRRESENDGTVQQVKDVNGGSTETGAGDSGAAHGLRGGPGEGGIESYSGLGREDKSEQNTDPKDFVRWSASTETGDFIRDAARGSQFAIEIEGMPEHILVGVPSFNDRTHYLRMRLRKVSRRIFDMVALKRQCDMEAHKSGQRVAMAGFGLLASWWLVVYWISFRTTLGWDMAEPITVKFSSF